MKTYNSRSPEVVAALDALDAVIESMTDESEIAWVLEDQGLNPTDYDLFEIAVEYAEWLNNNCETEHNPAVVAEIAPRHRKEAATAA